jgi:poly(A) polymerase
MHPALHLIERATVGTRFERNLYLVGGAVRDELLGIPHSADFDLVTTQPSAELAALLAPLSSIPVVTYERFGTAMLRIADADIELVTARRESYDQKSRKPNVSAATLEEDAERRDFTVNALMCSLHTGELLDPTGKGLDDLQSKTLRTPLDPAATFYDDPLRMLRAVRFRWKLGFTPVPPLYKAISDERDRLKIVSMERIRDEFVKMLKHSTAPNAAAEMMELGLFESFVPEFIPMEGCEQGNYHHLDVWNHTLLVLRNAGAGDLLVSLAALFHDVGKPETRSIDSEGKIRFFAHEAVGASMTERILRRLKFPQRDAETVALLVKNHMRLGSSPEFTPTAARRLLRDLGDQTERLLDLVEADANGLKAGVRVLDLIAIRRRLQEVAEVTPIEQIRSPISGERIMQLTGLSPGPQVGQIKQSLTERVLEGELLPADIERAEAFALAEFNASRENRSGQA